MLYRADPPAARIVETLDAFTAVFHRPSGTTHLLVPPAPEILQGLGNEAMTLDALLTRLSRDYHLVDAEVDGAKDENSDNDQFQCGIDLAYKISRIG